MSYEERLDPEVISALENFRPTLDSDLGLLGSRQAVDRYWAVVFAVLPPPEFSPQVSKEDFHIQGPPDNPHLLVRVYRPLPQPAGEKRAALVWIHGGGFYLGNVYEDDLVCERFVLETGCNVASVEYRRSPEHPYPAAIEDCYAALQWLAGQAEAFQVDPARIAVGGASAGGCLSAALALLARDRHGPPVAFQLLLIPVIDDRLTTPSSYTVTDKRVWNRDIARLSWQGYLANVSGEVPPYAAPGRATDLRGLPPAYVAVDGQDILRDEGIQYAQRLMQAGVHTELHVFPGTFHGALFFAPGSAIGQRAQAEFSAVLRKAFFAKAALQTDP